MNVTEALRHVFGHEGGYVNNPKDPGGETKFGVSKRSYPALDIKNLTLDDAAKIMERDFWGPAGCDVVPDLVRYPLFDFAVNSGVSRAVKMLQRCVGEVEDGVIGPRTLQAINSMDPARLVARLNGQRLEFLASLPDEWWDEFGKGVTRRVASILKGT